MAKVSATLTVVVGVVLAVALLSCSRGSSTSGDGSTLPAANTAPPVSLEGHAEAPAGIDLAEVRNAAFASLTLVGTGGMRAFMVAAGQPEFARLADAVAGSTPTKGTVGDTGSSLVFVLKDGTLVSFALDREQLLLARSGRAYRPAADFAPVLAVIEGKAE